MLWFHHLLIMDGTDTPDTYPTLTIEYQRVVLGKDYIISKNHVLNVWGRGAMEVNI